METTTLEKTMDTMQYEMDKIKCVYKKAHRKNDQVLMRDLEARFDKIKQVFMTAQDEFLEGKTSHGFIG
jgi:hypothetical protein